MRRSIYLQKQNKNESYLTDKSSELRLTVLVFDSGVGGLSIYNKIRELLPDIYYIYVFDNTFFPYGEKNEKFIIKRVIEIVGFIQKLYPLALAVIACNTASVVALPALRRKFQFPIIGVVPAIKPAASLTTNGIVGLLATRGTVNFPYTHSLIRRFANKCQIKLLGSAELVDIAEGKLHNRVVSVDSIRRILQPWLCIGEPPDTIILGCTHFVLLRDELISILPEGTRLVDTSAAIAHRTAWLLKNNKVLHRRYMYPKSIGTNIAYCMALTLETEQLLPTLRYYGFKTLKKL